MNPRPRSPHTCTGFIFDVDATLVDTTLVIDRIWQTWCDQKGLAFSDVRPHVHGRKIGETLALVGPAFCNAEEEVAVQTIAVEAMHHATATTGALAFVAKLPPSSWAIATSGPRQVARTSLAAAGFTLPDVMVCAEDVARGKPDPQPFQLAAQGLRMDASRCVAFEDSPAGIQSAKAAGCFAVALTTSHEAAELGLADVVVGSFLALDVEWSESGFLLRW